MTRMLLHAGLINAVLAVALAVVVAALARLFRGRPALVHGLWLLVLLKLVTPPILPLTLPWPALHDEPATLIVAEPVAEGLAWGACPGSHLQEGPAAQRLPTGGEESESSAPATSNAWPMVLVLGLWLTGTLGCWSAAGLRLIRLHRTLRIVPRAPVELQERLDRLAARMGLRRRPRVLLVPGVMPPMLLAFGGLPRLLAPAELWRRLDEAQRDTLLLHELAHLRRGDHHVRWLELVVLGLYWWHPLVWWVSRVLRDAEEECCDAWVVWAAPEAAPAYAATLVETIAFLSHAPAALPAGASGAGPVRLFKRRLTMILRGSTPRSLSWPALAMLLLLGAALLPLAPAMVRSGQPPAKKPATTGNDTIQFLEQPQQYSCLRCHVAAHPRVKPLPAARKTEDLHAEVIRLMTEVKNRRDELARAEAALKDALKRFDAALPRKAVPPAGKDADPRLESVEKKLERLLQEVESLRKEMQKAKGAAGPAADGKAQTMKDQQAPSLLVVARQHFNRGDYKTALQFCEEMIKRFPDQIKGLEALGTAVFCHAALGQMDKVRAGLSEMKRLLPKMPPSEIRSTWEVWLKDVEQSLGGEGRNRAE